MTSCARCPAWIGYQSARGGLGIKAPQLREFPAASGEQLSDEVPDRRQVLPAGGEQNGEARRAQCRVKHGRAMSVSAAVLSRPMQFLGGSVQVDTIP